MLCTIYTLHCMHCIHCMHCAHCVQSIHIVFSLYIGNDTLDLHIEWTLCVHYNIASLSKQFQDGPNAAKSGQTDSASRCVSFSHYSNRESRFCIIQQYMNMYVITSRFDTSRSLYGGGLGTCAYFGHVYIVLWFVALLWISFCFPREDSGLPLAPLWCCWLT